MSHMAPWWLQPMPRADPWGPDAKATALEMYCPGLNEFTFPEGTLEHNGAFIRSDWEWHLQRKAWQVPSWLPGPV